MSRITDFKPIMLSKNQLGNMPVREGNFIITKEGGIAIDTSEGRIFTAEKGDKGDTGTPGRDADMSYVLADYVAEALPGYIKKVKSAIMPMDIVMVMVTDTHASYESDRDYRMQSLYAFAEVANRIKPHFAAHLGDVLSDSTTGEVAAANSARWQEWAGRVANVFDGIKPTFLPVLRGNHDNNLHDGNATDKYIDNRAFYDILGQPYDFSRSYIRNAKTEDTLLNPYYYTDFDSLKLRVICLNSSDFPTIVSNQKYTHYDNYGWQNDQLNWLAQTALKTNYRVLILNHTPPSKSMNYGPDWANGGQGRPVENEELLKGILQAFVDGSAYAGTSSGPYAATVICDFTNQGKGKAVAFIHGHNHADCVGKPGIYPMQPIGLCAGLAYTRPLTQLPLGSDSPSPRNANDISNIAVTTLIYSPHINEIKTFRLGAGRSYIIPLDGEQPQPEKEYAIYFKGGKGKIPFGKGLDLTKVCKIKAKIEFDDISGTQYLFHSSSGDQRFYFGSGNKARSLYGFGEKSSVSGKTTFKVNTPYEIEWDMSNGKDLVCTINGEVDAVISTSSEFSPAQDLTLATNASASSTTYFKGILHSLSFINQDRSIYAKYNCNEGEGSTLTDSSGNGRDILLSGECAWLQVQ